MSRRAAFFTLVAALVVVGAPFVGVTELGWEDLRDLSGSSPGGLVLWHIRVPRVASALLAGAGLAIGGAAFQALFRNPLATPYTLGVASGAAFGMALGMRLRPLFAGLEIDLGTVSALIGAGLAIGAVWAVARMRPDFSTSVLLLAGVAMTFFFSSLILFLQYTTTLGDSFRLVRWLMGGLGSTDWGACLRLLVFVTSGGLVIGLRARDLDLLTIGDATAAGRGVDVRRVQRQVFLGTSLMVGGVVSVCGPIGFVGMMAPHIARLSVGGLHRNLLPAAAIFGGAFLVASDTVARTIIAPVELPVGVITAFLGGPFFLWLLVRRTEGR